MSSLIAAESIAQRILLLRGMRRRRSDQAQRSDKMFKRSNSAQLPDRLCLIRPTDAGASHARDRSGSRAWLAPAHSQRGISLIELIMFIVIVSVALAGILLVMNATSKGSANPLIQKQALAIAESLLEEVELMPFTICDPGDVNAASAVTAADCTGGAGGANDESRLPLGPEAGETRYHPTTPFDNVSDYNGFTMNPGNGGIRDITGTLVATLGGFSATITVAQQSVGGIAAAESLLITVSATGPDGTPVVVDGVRTRYAPRTTP